LVVVVTDEDPVVAAGVVVVTDEDPVVVVEVVCAPSAPDGAERVVTNRTESIPTPMMPRFHFGVFVSRGARMTLWMIRILCDSFTLFARRNVNGGMIL
jgi:hypothetical protein